MQKHNSHCPHLPSLFFSQLPAFPAEKIRNIRPYYVENIHTILRLTRNHFPWNHISQIAPYNNRRRNNRCESQAARERRLKAQTWTPANKPGCLKISLSNISSVLCKQWTHSHSGRTLRLCRELCFSLFRKKTADCVWERVRGLDDGSKAAGSAEWKKGKCQRGTHTHTQNQFILLSH